MPDGPPWISNVNVKDVLIIDTNVSCQGRKGFHVEFDENKRWTVEFVFVRKAGNENELSAHIAYPTGSFPPGAPVWTVFWTCNDHYPENPHIVPNVKFDNEDIFVWSEWKIRPIPGEGWNNCVDITHEEGGPERSWCRLTFRNADGTSNVEVKLTRSG